MANHTADIDIDRIARDVLRPGSAELREVTMAHCLSATLQLIALGKERDGAGNLIEINPSIVKAVDNCMPIKLMSLDRLSIQRVAKHAVETGDSALQRCEAPNECTRVLAVAYAILKMVEQQQIDIDSTLAATALGITMEAETDGDVAWALASRPRYYADQILSYIDQGLRRY